MKKVTAISIVLFLALSGLPRESSANSDPLLLPVHTWSYGGVVNYGEVGKSVAYAGDVNQDGFGDVIIGAPYHSGLQGSEGRSGGTIVLFLGTVTGLRNRATAFVEEEQLDAGLGHSVASAGDVNGDGFGDVIVGAPFYDGRFDDDGRAYLYLGTRQGIDRNAMVVLGDLQADARFGYTVSSAGDVNGDGHADVLVAAPFYGSGTVGGRVYLYAGSSGSLQSEPVWSAEGGVADAAFGTSLACAGDVNGDGYDDVIIGSPHYSNGDSEEGAVFVYYGSPEWLPGVPDWRIEGDQESAWLGSSVASAGDVNGDGYADVLIGASGYRPNPASIDGQALAYLGSPSGLEPDPYWQLSYGSDSRFGFSVASAGDLNGDGRSEVLVGSQPRGSAIASPMAFLFVSSADGIETKPNWSIKGTYPYSTPWPAVSTAGDVNGDGFSDVIVGNPASDYQRDGLARVFHALPSLVEMDGEPDETHGGGRLNEWFGCSLSSAGDVDGDGWPDVIVGAYLNDENGPEAGAAYVYSGPWSGLENAGDRTYEWSARGSAGDWFGYSVSSAGDINGDGYDDVLIGSPRYSEEQTDAGAVFLYLGSELGLAEQPTWIGEGGQAGAEHGFSVARAGDVNGDGYGDVVVGAFRYSRGQNESGRVLVYFGSPYGFHESRVWATEGDQPGAWFGYSVSGAGDVNGDGLSDIVVGAPYYDDGEVDEGMVFVYLGSVNGVGRFPALRLGSDQAGARLGMVVSAAGDVYGDGFGDILAGGAGHPDAVGFVYLIEGRPAGLAASPSWTAFGSQFGTAFGRTVSCAGDVNADGFSDVVIGDALYHDVGPASGRVDLYFGAAGGLSGSPDWTATGDSALSRFGHAVTGIGDVNGDGASDILVGAPLLSKEGGEESGAVALFATDLGMGFIRAPRQRTADGSSPVGLLGFSGEIACQLRVDVAPPPGASEVLVEWEVKPYRVPFDGTDLWRGSTHKLGPSEREAGTALSLDQAILPLGASSRFHWRVRLASDAPSFPHTRWFEHPYNMTGEACARLGVPREIPPPPPPEPEEPPVPTLGLEPVFPNPFNPLARIEYSLPVRGHVRIEIYDVAGRRVRTLVDELEDEGPHLESWDGLGDDRRPRASGVYFLRLDFAGQRLTRKMILIR